jgi:hypothetical protein
MAPNEADQTTYGWNGHQESSHKSNRDQVTAARTEHGAVFPQIEYHRREHGGNSQIEGELGRRAQSTPSILAPNMVAPARDTPGINAAAGQIPIPSAVISGKV